MDLYKLFPKGYDTLYARFYVKFLTRYSRIHHFVKMGGSFPPEKWPMEMGQFIPSQDRASFEGFQWQNNDGLKLNFFWLSYFMTDGKPGEIDKVLFDDVIVSTRYIGPH